MHSTMVKCFKKSFIVTLSTALLLSSTLCANAASKLSDFRYHWSDEEVQNLIDKGLLSQTDYLYMTAVGMECPYSYDGFLAVACCVLNRLENRDKYHSVRDVVVADGQFLGYNDPYTHPTLYKQYCTEYVRDAAVDALLGTQSPIGECEYFFCPIDGYDMWANANISEFYVVEGNVFFKQEDADKGCAVHNMYDYMDPAKDILIWDHVSGGWLFSQDYHYVN